MEKIIDFLKRQIQTCKDLDEDLFRKSWSTQTGILLTANEAQKIVDELKHLQHYKDSTIGLWATDKLEKVHDPNKILFQLDDKISPTINERFPNDTLHQKE